MGDERRKGGRRQGVIALASDSSLTRCCRKFLGGLTGKPEVSCRKRIQKAIKKKSPAMRRRRQFSTGDYCSFAYSALAFFRMGMSGSASLQRAFLTASILAGEQHQNRSGHAGRRGSCHPATG